MDSESMWQATKRRVLMERSVEGRIATTPPQIDVPLQDLPTGNILRSNLRLPELTEGDIVRYFTSLSQMNFSVDTNLYPLGSCTMKYNPKINDEIASTPGLSNLHPMQPDETVQGALELMYMLQDYLKEITGMTGCSLATLAGAHGELAGMLMIRAYHLSLGDSNRDLVLIPDSAHGTNPASATMAGCRVESIRSNTKGNIDINELKEKLSPKVAGIMITLPNTLGLFENDITEICDMAHDAGALVYGDGANMNALLGQVKPGKLGFDVVHINLHKTFSTPHGGGGPGAGPLCVTDNLVPFLPNPLVSQSRRGKKDSYRFVKPSKSIGRVGSFHGNFGVLVRAYSYIRLLGKTGLKEISSHAVLNANYIRKKLKDYYHIPFDRPCMHEVVISAKNQLDHGVKALDIAKRLLDYGIHPPTMYFPLIVEEALMIEPTETESKETIDYFIEVMRKIYQESIDSPELLHEAPHSTPVSRLDEAKAARDPDLRWTSDD